MPLVLPSIHLLLNCSLNGSVYPALEFAETIPEVTAYVKQSDNQLVYLSKFVLSCFVQYLNFSEILCLKLTEEEAKFCISDLAVSAKSPDLEGDNFTASELLSILINFTNPCGPALQKLLTTTESKRSSVYCQSMLKAVDVFRENDSVLMIDSLFESIEMLLKASAGSIQEKCVQLLWNMIHYIPARKKVVSRIISTIQAYQNSMLSGVRMTSFCVLHLLGLSNSGMYECSVNV